MYSCLNSFSQGDHPRLSQGGGFHEPKTQCELQSLCSHLVFVCVSPTRNERHQMRNVIKVLQNMVLAAITKINCFIFLVPENV